MPDIDTAIVLTGASRGLGAALARGLARPGVLLVTIARRPDAALQDHAQAQGCRLAQIAADLSDPQAAAGAAAQMTTLLPQGAARLRLINNAGALQPVGRVDALTDGRAIAATLSLNVAAAITLTAAFLQAAAGRPADCRVLNISSGAGRNTFPGWGVYCASKAALDMYTRVAADEYAAGGARFVSLAPGVIDTAMQADIRASDPAHFPALERFQAMHREGKLASPEAVAARLIDYLERDDFGATVVDDIRNY